MLAALVTDEVRYFGLRLAAVAITGVIMEITFQYAMISLYRQAREMDVRHASINSCGSRLPHYNSKLQLKSMDRIEEKSMSIRARDSKVDLQMQTLSTSPKISSRHGALFEEHLSGSFGGSNIGSEIKHPFNNAINEHPSVTSETPTVSRNLSIRSQKPSLHSLRISSVELANDSKKKDSKTILVKKIANAVGSPSAADTKPAVGSNVKKHILVNTRDSNSSVEVETPVMKVPKISQSLKHSKNLSKDEDRSSRVSIRPSHQRTADRLAVLQV